MLRLLRLGGFGETIGETPDAWMAGYPAAMSPVAKRILFSWIATDMLWASLFIYVLKRDQD